MRFNYIKIVCRYVFSIIHLMTDLYTFYFI